jgi:cephalosporin-C deacetylase-like acetyl esterase
MTGISFAADNDAADSSRIHPEGEAPHDARLGHQRTLSDAYHPWAPPTSKEAWDREAAKIRRQLQVACGLWPMPEKQPLDPTIHGLVDRGDYTVERVYFHSRPGLLVTGSLFRPKHSQGKHPAVLSPYGHWQDGRFYDAGDNAAKGELKSGAESFLSGAHAPLQARMVQLVRMGCVVFHYDMIGVADNKPLPHREGFNDVEAELWLENKLGLQTWNSIRALDFLCSLPDVDPQRIGVTGASGGGTQTFMLCALDDRPAAAFPAVMVSTAMQGGCQCENASYLRLSINNIAIAALTAPRPMKMSGANDWTIDIETKGLPELKQIYSLFGKPELVDAKCHPEFGHNYNEVSREMMYAWFAEHLNLGDAAIEQSDFVPLSREELTVFDAEHPLPQDALPAEQLRDMMTHELQDQFAALIPKSASDAGRYREVIGGAAAVLLGSLPDESDLNHAIVSEETVDGLHFIKATCGREGQEIPTIVFDDPDRFQGKVLIWVDAAGKSALFGDDGKPTAAVRELTQAGYAVVSPDVFLTGEFLTDPKTAVFPVDKGFPGYTYCYNAPLISQRVQDILTLIAAAKGRPDVKSVELVGTGDGGLWALLAASAAGDSVARTVADLGGFRFTSVKEVDDPNLLPGALRYGDVDGFAALAVANNLAIFGAAGEWNATRAMSEVTGKPVRIEKAGLNADGVAREFTSRK